MKKLIILTSLLLSSLVMANDNSIVSIDSDNKLVEINTCTNLTYPSIAAMKQETGTVILDFKLSKEGDLIKTSVEQTSFSKDLDRASIVFLKSCKFLKPTNNIYNGRVKINWSLEK